MKSANNSPCDSTSRADQLKSARTTELGALSSAEALAALCPQGAPCGPKARQRSRGESFAGTKLILSKRKVNTGAVFSCRTASCFFDVSKLDACLGVFFCLALLSAVNQIADQRLSDTQTKAPSSGIPTGWTGMSAERATATSLLLVPALYCTIFNGPAAGVAAAYARL